MAARYSYAGRTIILFYRRCFFRPPFSLFFAVRGRFADRYQALPHVQDDPDL